jgi:serine/threonine-protein kinase
MHPLVRSLFRELQDLPPDAREKLFTDRGIDREIRAEVESLLRFDSPRDHAFTEGVAEIVEDAIRLAAPGRASADGGRAGRLPETVGPYRIHREIGRGGMGRVFLAEQEEADFRRTVALKIIDRPGASEHTIRSFRDEVRILASLEHDRIARFFDGGRTPDGTWFLALEYVDGEDLLTYVRGHRLDARARVELFL